jgi:hypothetical protein
MQVAIVAVLSLWIAVSLNASQPAAWFQSPVSPLQPGEASQIPFPVPTPAGREPFRLFSESVWSSPLPWIVVGLVVFGGLAWALMTLLRRFQLPERQQEGSVCDQEEVDRTHGPAVESYDDVQEAADQEAEPPQAVE